MTRVMLDESVRRYDGGRVLVGGAGRIIRLTDAGAAALDALLAGAAHPALARRLVDAGLAHPVAPRVEHVDATIVIPVRDRPQELDRCLAALAGRAEAPARRNRAGAAIEAGAEAAAAAGPTVVVDRGSAGAETAAAAGPTVVVGDGSAAAADPIPVVGDGSAAAAVPAFVVDDGSSDAGAIASVCARHRARLLRRAVPGGPAAARNHALAHVGTELVAFLDSDCVPPPGWVHALAGHFADPGVAAVAPRVLDPALDMGARPADVAPGTRVAYVPSAALIVRRAALGGGFDEALRYGEDVDLVWRLHDRGWRIRYDPRVIVAHGTPRGHGAAIRCGRGAAIRCGRGAANRCGRGAAIRCGRGAAIRGGAAIAAALDPALLARRYRYGTSAAPLALRHPGRLAPFVLAPAPTFILALLAARRPRAAAAVLALQSALLARRLRGLRVPVRLAPYWTLRALAHTAAGIVRGHPAYRAGVVAGAVRHRTAAPLTPQLKLALPAAIRSAPRRWRTNNGSE